MNKKMYHAAVLAALGLASVTAAQAVNYNQDLIVGFTTGSGNDLVYDLGSISSLPGYGGATATWNLSAALTAAGLGSSLSTVQWGVVGANIISGQDTSWITVANGTPNSVPNNSQWSADYSAVSTIYKNSITTAGVGNYGTPGTAASYSWYQQTDNNQNLSGTTFFANSQNPNVTGLADSTFWQQISDNSTPTQLGSFSLGSDSILTYTSVPEPTSMALMSLGGGFLMLVGRNKFGRKQQS